jgi:hypothetical protein
MQDGEAMEAIQGHAMQANPGRQEGGVCRQVGKLAGRQTDGRHSGEVNRGRVGRQTGRRVKASAHKFTGEARSLQVRKNAGEETPTN